MSNLMQPDFPCYNCLKAAPKGEDLCLVKCPSCKGPTDLCQSCYNKGCSHDCIKCRNLKAKNAAILKGTFTHKYNDNRYMLL